MNEYYYVTIYTVIRQELKSRHRAIKNVFVHTITATAVLFLGFKFFLLPPSNSNCSFVQDYRTDLCKRIILNRFQATTDYTDYGCESSSKITFHDGLILRCIFRYDKFMAVD